LLQQGVHPIVVSERLGDSTIGITMGTYTHVLSNMQKEAALQFEQLLKLQLFNLNGCGQNVTKEDIFTFFVNKNLFFNLS